MKIRPGDRVVVKWLDAYGHHDAWTMDGDAFRGKKFKVETLGYCLGRRKGYLRLCGDWAKGQKGRVFAIPCGMVLSVERI